MPTLLGMKEFLIMEEDKMLWNHADSNIEVIGKAAPLRASMVPGDI